MINNDAVVEAMIKDKGLTAPRVMPKAIDALVASLIYKVVRFEGTTLMVAAAFLPSGFEVGTGKSACASPENFNAEIGEKIAVDNARDAARQKLWELEGYALHKALESAKVPEPVPEDWLNLPPTFKERVIHELGQLTIKINALAAFLVQPPRHVSPGAISDLDAQYTAMMAYAQVLVRRIEAF